MGLPYTEISHDRVSRGVNVNGSLTPIPPYRVVGSAVSATYDDAIDLLSVVGNAKMKGVTSHTILAGQCGDVHTTGVVPVESDGTAAIAAGDLLTADGSIGRVLKAIPGAGVNAEIVGRAATPAAATAGALVMVDLIRSRAQG